MSRSAQRAEVRLAELVALLSLGTDLGFGQSDEMRATFALMQADLDGAQGPGYWKTYLADCFARCTQPPGYTFEDLRRITVPTLVLTGDRDHFCSVEDGVTAYRMLEHGELAVLPNHGHLITPAAVQVTIEFLQRQLEGQLAPASS